MFVVPWQLVSSVLYMTLISTLRYSDVEDYRFYDNMTCFNGAVRGFFAEFYLSWFLHL